MNTVGLDPTPCDRCNGSGMRTPSGDDELAGQYQPCPVCHGYGHRSRRDARHLPSLARSVVLAGAFVMVVVTLMVISSH
ncbi:MAG: hypothetical protein JWO77_1158 [Ilumatobacteraceae bacterium]|nr:hypothetical protein [Ilumatobacteraceae bacterium]